MEPPVGGQQAEDTWLAWTTHQGMGLQVDEIQESSHCSELLHRVDALKSRSLTIFT